MTVAAFRSIGKPWLAARRSSRGMVQAEHGFGRIKASRPKSASEMTRIMVGNPDRTQRIGC